MIVILYTSIQRRYKYINHYVLAISSSDAISHVNTSTTYSTVLEIIKRWTRANRSVRNRFSTQTSQLKAVLSSRFWQIEISPSVVRCPLSLTALNQKQLLLNEQWTDRVTHFPLCFKEFGRTHVCPSPHTLQDNVKKQEKYKSLFNSKKTFAFYQSLQQQCHIYHNNNLFLLFSFFSSLLLFLQPVLIVSSDTSF